MTETITKTLPTVAKELAGLDHVPVASLVPFQGDLKELSQREYSKLKKSILENGLIVPFFVWLETGKLLDAHQRCRVFIKEGWLMDVPIVYISADSEQDAKRKLLVISSQYGKVTQEGWDAFTWDLEDDWLQETVQFDALPFVFDLDLSGDSGAGEESDADDDVGYRFDRGDLHGRVLMTKRQHGIELVKRLKDDGENLTSEVAFWAGILAKLAPECDVVTCAPQRKPRPFHLATHMAQIIAGLLNLPFVKLLEQEKEDGDYHIQYLPEKLTTEKFYKYLGGAENKRVLVVDDAVSTRKTATAIFDAIKNQAQSVFFIWLYSAHG